MGLPDLIDFSTSCPWELYLFAFWHLFAGATFYYFDACPYLTSKPCTDAERFWERIVALSLVYVGVIFTVLTYHNKQSVAKITRLSNVALNGAIALLAGIVFTGNASLAGGMEPSWMHKIDMLVLITLVGILSVRVAKPDAEWAQINAINEGMGINCKTLLLFFFVATAIKFVAMTDFMDPAVILQDGSKMTHMATLMWKFATLLLLELLLAFGYVVLFEDDDGLELTVLTLMIMALVSTLSVLPVQKFMSDWMMSNSKGTLWMSSILMVILCITAIIGGRRGSGRNLPNLRPSSGYQEVASNA